MGRTEVVWGQFDKWTVSWGIIKVYSVAAEEIAFIADESLGIEIFELSGVAVIVNDAADYVKAKVAGCSTAKVADVQRID